MKYLLITLLAACSLSLKAQVANTPEQQTSYGPMQFNTRFYDAVDHWVAIPKTARSQKYVFGFIYVDAMAGFTFRLEGSFDVDAQGHVFRDSADLKPKLGLQLVRLGKNTIPMYLIPEQMLPELHLPPVPVWLAIYKTSMPDKNSIAYKVMMGKHLNSAGECTKALEYLEDAYKTEPHAAGLEFELSYAYNELGQFSKSVDVLSAALANQPNNTLFYKELGFSYMRAGYMENAIKTYNKGILIAQQTDKRTMLEMVQNLTQVYMQLKRFDESITAINNALAIVPGNSTMYILLGDTYTNSGNYDDGIKNYIAAMDAKPALDAQLKGRLAWNVATIYRDQKHDDENYKLWGKKAKDMVPLNSQMGQYLKGYTF